MIDINIIKDYLLHLQDQICAQFVDIDSNLVLKEDQWERKSGGGGRTRVFSDGKVFE